MSGDPNHDYDDPDLYEESESHDIDEPVDDESDDLFGEEPELKFSVAVDRDVHVIMIDKSKTLDAYEVETLGDQIYEFLEARLAPKVVVDLGNIDHLSSAALGMLIALRAVVERDGGVLCVANVSDDLQALLKMTKLHKVIKIYNSLKEAVGNMAA